MTPQRAKEIGIIASVLLYSVLVFGLTSLFVWQNRLTALPVLIFLGVLALVWVALTAIALAVLQQPGSSAWVIMGIGGTLAGAGLLQIPALVAGGLLIILLFLARRSLYREINNRVLFRVSEAFRPGLRLILFALGLSAVGLTWPALADRVTPASFLLSPATVGKITEKIVPALPGPFIGAVDVNQVTVIVTSTVNKYIQSLLATYRGLFLLIVLLLAISAWRAILPFVVWAELALISGLIYLARQANLVYLTRSQATIERLHL